LLEEWRFRVEGLRQGEARLRITGRELGSRSRFFARKAEEGTG
jgi:hypothetical protein